MLLLDIPAIQSMLKSIGLREFYLKLIHQMEEDFSHWKNFHKSPRHATYYDHGVIELMPCSDEDLYSFKFVNGHPDNTKEGKLCVAAMGLLADVESGYTLMISEMTLLTAIRTAAVAAMGAKYLARPKSRSLCIIGSGAQSEFQAIAMQSVLPIEELKIYDTDMAAMNKFISNMSGDFKTIIKCNSASEAIKGADVIVTATAANKRSCLFSENEINPGTHIHAMGGDGPGKTELGINLLKQSKLIVEFSEQTLIEGEIQQLSAEHIYAELWQIIKNEKPGRENDSEITVFDSVGFGLEDLSTLKLIYKLAQELNFGKDIYLTPDLEDPKDLYSLLS